MTTWKKTNKKIEQPTESLYNRTKTSKKSLPFDSDYIRINRRIHPKSILHLRLFADARGISRMT